MAESEALRKLRLALLKPKSHDAIKMIEKNIKKEYKKKDHPYKLRIKKI